MTQSYITGPISTLRSIAIHKLRAYLHDFQQTTTILHSIQIQINGAEEML